MEYSEKIVLTVIGVVLICSLVLFIALYFIERRKNVSTKDDDKKIVGNGIKFNNRMTEFTITKEIIPLISEKIFDLIDVCLAKASYENLLNKSINSDNVDEVEKYVNIVVRMNFIMNEFKNQYGIGTNGVINKRIEELRYLYYDIIILNPNACFKTYATFLKRISNMSNESAEIEISKEMLTKINEISPFIRSHDELVKKLDDVINKYSTTNWGKLKTYLTTKSHITTYSHNANKILSTGCLENRKEQYYEIIGMTPKEYVEIFNKFFGIYEIELIQEGKIYQCIDEYKRRDIYTGVGSIFSKDDTLRNWYNPNDIKQFTGIVHKTFSDAMIKSLPAQTKINGNYQIADVVPASVINAMTQSLILLFIAYDNDFGKNREKLFKFLLATRLNMTFINMLANVQEINDFNLELLDSYHVEPK